MRPIQWCSFPSGAIQVPRNENGDEIPIYVVLGNFTQKRIETIKNLPEGVKDATNVFKAFGTKLLQLVFTLGRYDVVAIFEAPNEEAITKALLSWGSQGLLRTETLTGFTPEKMIELVKVI
jgi:uncharacterized protein with GYD domain